MKLKCPRCDRNFTRTALLMLHLQKSHKDSTDAVINTDIDTPRNRLFSRYFTGGVFDFENVISNKCTAPNVRSNDTNVQVDDNSYYSDVRNDYEYDFLDDDDDMVMSTSNKGDVPTVGNTNENENVADDESNEDNRLEYFTPPPIPDANVPLSDNIYCDGTTSFTSSAHFKAQLQLSELFNRNKGSLKMYDEVIDIMNMYIRSPDFDRVSPILKRKQFLKSIDHNFNMSVMKPTYGSIQLYDGTLATVPVYDMKTMILSILHDDSLMRTENFAPGLDIFTGDIDAYCDANKYYGEINFLLQLMSVPDPCPTK